MPYNAGTAYISVRPDFSDFQSGIKAKMAALGDESGKAYAGAFQAQLEASFAGLPAARVKADADTAEAKAKLDEAARPRTAKVRVEADQSSLQKFAADVKKAVNFQSPVSPLVGLIGAGSIALGPQALGLTAGVAGLGAGFAAAAADAGAFGVVAKGMFADVTDAQKKLTQATDAYNKATTDKGRQKALADEQKALAGLTPAERQLATELTGLESAWKKMTQAEQPVVGAALAPWLATATSGMQLLDPLVQDGAGAVRLLGEEAQKALQAPFWGTFFGTLGTTGQLALIDFGQAAGRVADGLAHLFVTFAPDIDNLLPLVDRAAAAFDKWARSVSDKGLQDFFAKTFSPQNVARLKSDLSDVAKFLEDAAKAGGELSPAAFSGLSNVLDIMAKLTPDEIIALTGLFLAARALGGIGSVAGLGKAVIGLFSGGAQAAEQAAEGTAAGTAAGTSAATAFTSTFSAEVAAALPEAFAAIGAEGGTEAGTAGTAWGTAAAAAFGASFGAEDALGITAGLTAVGTEGAVEAGTAGAAMGSAMAAGFTAAFDSEGTAEIGASIGAAGIGAVIAAGIAGAAIGGALGLGFTVALAAAGVGGAVGKIESDVKAAASGANTWLQPAGQQTMQGYISGIGSEAQAVRNAAAQARGWVQSGTAGSGSWLTPAGQQAAAGFAAAIESEHARINGEAAKIRAWVSEALPAPASWLVNIGVSVVQGLANGITSAAGLISSAVSYISGLIPSGVRSLLGINSPARVMIPLGSAVPEGLGAGMLGGAHYIRSAGSRLADVTAQSLAGIAAGQSAAALSALGVPVIAPAARLPGAGAPLSSGQLQLAVTYAGPSGDAVAAIVQGLQFHIQSATGGDVQAALGQGPVRV